jgi:hypothetical membrane protein
MFDVTGHRMRLLALWGGAVFVVSTIQYGIAQVVAASAWDPAYSWTDNFISDLGNTSCGAFAVHGATSYVCSPLHGVMNASFVVGGLLTITGTLLLWNAWPARPMATAALVLWLASGVLKIVVGVAPENTIASLHLLGALNLPLQSIAIVLLSVVILRDQRTLAGFGLVVGVVSLAAACLSTAAQTAGPALNLGLGAGGMERLAGYPGNLWMAVVGIVVIAQAVARPTSTRPLPLAPTAAPLLP